MGNRRYNVDVWERAVRLVSPWRLLRDWPEWWARTGFFVGGWSSWTLGRLPSRPLKLPGRWLAGMVLITLAFALRSRGRATRVLPLEPGAARGTAALWLATTIALSAQCVVCSAHNDRYVGTCPWYAEIAVPWMFVGIASVVARFVPAWMAILMFVGLASLESALEFNGIYAKTLPIFASERKIIPAFRALAPHSYIAVALSSAAAACLAGAAVLSFLLHLNPRRSSLSPEAPATS